MDMWVEEAQVTARLIRIRNRRVDGWVGQTGDD